MRRRRYYKIYAMRGADVIATAKARTMFQIKKMAHRHWKAIGKYAGFHADNGAARIVYRIHCLELKRQFEGWDAWEDVPARSRCFMWYKYNVKGAALPRRY